VYAVGGYRVIVLGIYNYFYGKSNYIHYLYYYCAKRVSRVRATSSSGVCAASMAG
jgi:hypothetical protein